MQRFTAVIKQHKDIDGAYVEPPFDVEKEFGAKRVKVKASFDGMDYRGSIVRMGGIFMLGLTKEIRKQIGKDFGDSVEVIVEKDVEDREVEIPSDFLQLLVQNSEAKSTYDQLSYSAKREYILWITSAKKTETRQNRITQALIRLSEGKKLKND